MFCFLKAFFSLYHHHVFSLHRRVYQGLGSRVVSVHFQNSIKRYLFSSIFPPMIWYYASVPFSSSKPFSSIVVWLGVCFITCLPLCELAFVDIGFTCGFGGWGVLLLTVFVFVCLSSNLRVFRVLGQMRLQLANIEFLSCVYLRLRIVFCGLWFVLVVFEGVVWRWGNALRTNNFPAGGFFFFFWLGFVMAGWTGVWSWVWLGG